ncbi:MAG: maleate cis-trans isomerase family protein [Sciscionella sp.]
MPWANTVVETELPRFGLATVVFHYSRLVPPDRSTALDESFLRGLNAAVPEALARMDRLPLSAVLMACTSAGFSPTASRPASVVTAFDALFAALRELRAKRIVLATPYPHDLTAREIEAFVRRRIGVVTSVSLGRNDKLADVTADEIHELLDEIDPSVLRDADALVLSCTAWPTLAVLPDLEATVDIPVISSNLAMAMYPFTTTAAGERA